jgi:hypothetical protein
MSKFKKRLQKISKKHLQYAVVVGNDTDYINDIVESFNTVFVISSHSVPPRHKNIIHIKDNTYISNLPDIDIIFISQGFEISDLLFFNSLVRRIQPVILLNTKFTISTEYYDLLRKVRYEQIDMLGEYQIWKFIRR